jgi:hypothetical protein
MREEYFAADRTIFIDSDPMYTQASIPAYVCDEIDEQARGRVEMLREHDVFFTFAENIGAADCLVPDALFEWIPTRQPVVLDWFRPYEIPVAERRQVLTTVASWEPTEDGPTVDGVNYTGKSTEFRRFIDLPGRSAVPLELAMSGSPPREELEQHGWTIREAYEVSHDPWVYRDYLADSLGEWSVAKNAYVASRSGWFSCRSACYLALGVPAIVQQTGFAGDIPTDGGVLAFETPDEAAACIDELASDPGKHARRAVEIAAECFDARKVLSSMIDRAGSATASQTMGGLSS